MEIPLDMSVGSSKPPPPYRDPLPGSTFSTMSRPSVITQAPKREITSNQENKESPKKPTVMPIDMSPTTTGMSFYLYFLLSILLKPFHFISFRFHINGRSSNR